MNEDLSSKGLQAYRELFHKALLELEDLSLVEDSIYLRLYRPPQAAESKDPTRVGK